jgi:beta-lactamase class A
MVSKRQLLVYAIALAVAGCQKAVRRPPSGPLNVARLAAGFPALAARAAPGLFGLGVMTLERAETWVSDPSHNFPMQSVFKAPMAAAALAQVDAGHLKLDQRLRITEADLSVPFSAINSAWPSPPRGHAALTPAVDLISLAVERSDNTAADTVMKAIGGPEAVTAWLQHNQIQGMRVDRYERDLQEELAGMPPFQPEWKDQANWVAERDTVPAVDREAAMTAYLSDARDTTTLPAALDFLAKLANGRLLSPASTRLLIKLMSAGLTGDHRFIAGLPKGTVLAQKTGTSSTDLGLTPAMGQIALATLPDGRRMAMAAFLAGSTATEIERERLFADSARLIVAAWS